MFLCHTGGPSALLASIVHMAFSLLYVPVWRHSLHCAFGLPVRPRLCFLLLFLTVAARYVQLFLCVLVVPDSPAVAGRRRPSMTDPSRSAHLPFRCFPSAYSTASTSCPSSPSLSSCYACSSHLLSYCLPLGSLLSLSSPSSRLCPMSVSFASYLYRPSHPTSSL